MVSDMGHRNRGKGRENGKKEFQNEKAALKSVLGWKLEEVFGSMTYIARNVLMHVGLQSFFGVCLERRRSSWSITGWKYSGRLL